MRFFMASEKTSLKIGRAVQQECRDRSRMPSSAWKKTKIAVAQRGTESTRAAERRARRADRRRAATLRTAGYEFRARSAVAQTFTESFFFFNDPAPPGIYTLSLHAPLPI